MRRICGILLVLLMLLPAVSCGKEEGEQVTNVYRSEALTLPEGFTVWEIQTGTDGFSVLCGDGENHMILRFDAAGEQISEETLSYENETLWDACVLPDGSVVCLYEADGVFSLVKRSNGENRVLCGDLAALYERQNLRFEQPTLAADGDGDLCLAGFSSLFLLDGEGTPLFDLTLTGSLQSVQLTADGQFSVTTFDRNTVITTIRTIDKAGRCFGDSPSLPDAMQNGTLLMGVGYDLYQTNSIGVYGWDSDLGERVLLCNWLNSDLIGNNVDIVGIIDAERLVVSYAGEADGSGELLYMTRVPDDQVPARKLIRVFTLNGIQSLNERAVVFNRSSEEYRVVIDVYQQYATDAKHGEDIMKEDILTGKIPDVMVFTRVNIHNDYRSEYIDAGMFADLYTLMDADPDFDRSCLPIGVLRAMERGGSLYELPVDISARTLMGKGENLPDGWTLEEFLGWAKEQGGAVIDVEGEYLLQLLLTCSMGEFVDWESGSCRFDSDLFRELLTFVKDYRAGSGTQLIDARLHYLGRFMTEQAKLQFEDVCFVGFPTTEGNGTQVYAMTSYGIAEKSEVKAGAWEFLKTLLDAGASSGMPATTAGIRSACEEMYDYHRYYGYDGKSSSSWSADSEMPANIDLNAGMLRDFTEEDCEALLSLLEDASPSEMDGTTLMNLILEEVRVYLAGDKPLEETVKIIQDRAGTYIAEQQ
ncbi:MAG: hypothetical protein IJ493_05165 [Clostridia bacterium]|nr:hypothetical protein [Clostridia bacterium]